MAELGEIVDALQKVEKMMSNLTRPEPGDSEHSRHSKEHYRWSLMHTLNGFAEDLAACGVDAAKRRSPGAGELFIKGGSRRN